MDLYIKRKVSQILYSGAFLFLNYLILSTNVSYAQISYQSHNNHQGNWEDLSTWTFSPASETWAPAKPNNPTNSNANAITIYGYVRSESGLTINNANPVVTINDTLFIVGNVSLGSGASLNVASSGILVIVGNLTLNGSFNLSNGGNIVVTGNVSVPNGNLQNNADFYVFQATSVPAGGGGVINGCNAYSGCNPVNAAGIRSETDLYNNNRNLFNFVNGITPVTLLYFKSVTPTSASGVDLAWATATELNFDQFIIQRASEGKEFEEIGRVKGAGFSKERNDYSFHDRYAKVGRLYYRLTALDYDGTSETFPIISVDYKGEKKIEVFPNPVRANEEVTIMLNFDPAPEDRLTIYNTEGKVLKIIQPDSVKSSYHFSSSGNFILRYVSPQVHSMVRVSVD